MIPKAQIKLIKSLSNKKYRKKHKLFIAEGVKLINELIYSEYKICTIYATNDWLEDNNSVLTPSIKERVFLTTPHEIRTISSLKSPNKVVATVEIPGNERIKVNYHDEIIIALDGIRDPGNMGSIIRIADWYNVQKVLCSPDCTDIFNSKVVQASMGSLFHIKILYTNLIEFIINHKKLNVYGAFIEGKGIHDIDFLKPALIIIGNESSGIKESLENKIENKICIPKYGKAESLNAAIAAGIIIDKIRKDLNKLSS